MIKRSQKVRGTKNKKNVGNMNDDSTNEREMEDEELETDPSSERVSRFIANGKPESFTKTRIFLIAIVVLLLVVLFILSVILFGLAEKKSEKVSKLSYNATRMIETLQNYTKEIVSYTPRLPGYPGGIATQKMISRVFSESDNWNVEYDSFTEQAPILGRLNFTNVIASYNGESLRSGEQDKKTLVIAAHFDSKYQKNKNKFQGATDSAVPCAMMLQMAAAFESMLDRYDKIPSYDLKFVFFDGEEAIRDVWAGDDNTYGSRHLAQKWLEQNKLSSIDLFVLLDLIGTLDVQFPDYSIHYNKNSDAHKRYKEIVAIETELKGQKNSNKLFFNSVRGGYIEDDHIHFMRKGVPILHLISYPFPSVWHNEGDNYEALDWNAIHDVQMILIEFLELYMFKQQ